MHYHKFMKNYLKANVNSSKNTMAVKNVINVN